MEPQVLAGREIPVEQGLVGQQPDLPADRPRRVRQGVPSTVAVPAWGRSSVASTRSRVDLPAPLGPKTTSVRPVSSVSETSCRAARMP
jgi:hypothetical protein